VADFNRQNETIYFRPSKSARSRHVPLNAEGVALFEQLRVGKVGDAQIFVRDDGTPWGKNHQVRPITVACEAAKISPAVTLREVRHTYASTLAQRGVDLLTISKLLGHADVNITARRYAHV